ncbi:sensor histidine kinase [Catenulispora rubra]|uniref:sensor histidine kinase n=1 Tax=Catenulispora rubra TaxID=280293 RepID=UPI0018924592|nr:sensor histidine kinase [Catenulispora rubra]
MTEPAGTATGPDGPAAVAVSVQAGVPAAASQAGAGSSAGGGSGADSDGVGGGMGGGADASAEPADDSRTATSPTVAEDSRESFRSWTRIARLWAVAWHFALLVAVVLVFTGRQPLWLLVLVAAMSASYLLLEYPWLLDRVPYRAVYHHLAIVSALSFVLVWVDPSLIFLASIVLSQFSPLAGFRIQGIATMAGVAAVLTLPILLRGDLTWGDLAGWTLTAGSALLVNLFIGGFFVEMLNDNDRRGALIRELEDTHEELERAHHEAGVREERERLAREIHDTLAQGFTSLLMLIQAADATLDTDPDTTRERLDLAARTARENLAEARALISHTEGGGDPTAGLPLDATLQRAAARIGEELGMATSVDIGGSPRTLSANAQVVTLRIAQEALANVRKHAQAATVTVWLTYGAEQLTLAVEDDGVGMPETPCKGFGLRSMRERVEQVGGALTITSAPGAGTRVEAEVPYE